MSKSLIRFRKKPVKPKRKIITTYTDFSDGDTLRQALEYLGNPDPDDCFFSADYDYNYDRMRLASKRPETGMEYEVRLAKYRLALLAYTNWYAANESTIKKEIKRREVEAKAKTKDRVEAEKKRLTRALAKLEKFE